MTATTNVQLVRNNANTSNPSKTGNHWFNLKVGSVEPNVGNSLVARAILSAAGDLAGADPVFNTETYQLADVRIQDVDAADYPDDETSWFETTDSTGSTVTIPSSDHNQRMEAALRHAAKEWGPDATDGFDQLVWNDQSIDVVITSYSATENAAQPKPGVFIGQMELTHVDVYVG